MKDTQKLAEDKYPYIENDHASARVISRLITDKQREAFIAGYEMDRWIRVEDELPEKAKPVLLYNGLWIGVGYYDKNHEHNIDEEPKWSDETGEYIPEDVTHWQPLPQPPKQ